MPSPPTRRLAFAQSFSLVFLSAGFGLCVLEFLCALCLSAVCIIDISVDQLSVGVSARARSACAHAAKRHSGSTLWPESGSAKPALGCLMGAPTSPSSCVLQDDKASRRVCPPELRT